MATILDVAERAGVSTATVSRVLSGSENVSGKTRAKVEEAIRALQYQYSPFAPTITDVAKAAGVSVTTAANVLNGRSGGAKSRTAVLQAAKTLGFSADAEKQPAFDRRNTVILATSAPIAEISNAIYRESSALGLNIIPLITGFSGEEEPVERPEFDAVGGILFLNCLERGLIRKLTGKIPVVQCGNFTDVPGTYVVSREYELGAFDITQHLISLGKRRIAMLGYLSVGNRALRFAELFRSGYLRALDKNGIEYRPELYYDAGDKPMDLNYETQATILANLLAGPERPDAILCFHYASASLIVTILGDMGIRVPEDIAVASLTDKGYSLTCNPGLTCVQEPNAEMGTEAVRIMSRLLNSGSVPEYTMFRHKLRISGSTDAALSPFGERIE